jgi:hypothetical protein
MTQAPNRRQRRLAMKYQGLLKAKSKLPFHKWMEVTRESIERGKELHAATVDAQDKKISELLESMESQKIVAWKEIGYNESEIKMLREANAILSVKDKKTWHTDKKVARKLMKDARESLNKRLND